MIGKLVTFFFVGLIALVVGSIVLALFGLVFSVALSVAGFLLFKVAPIVLIGYLVVRFVTPKHKRLAAAEQRWIEN